MADTCRIAHSEKTILTQDSPVRLFTYLNYGGNCREAFEFYAKHLGGKITMLLTFADQPDPGNAPPGSENKILHARMDVADTTLLGADVPPDRFQPMRSAR